MAQGAVEPGIRSTRFGRTTVACVVGGTGLAQGAVEPRIGSARFGILAFEIVNPLCVLAVYYAIVITRGIGGARYTIFSHFEMR